ncbi:MAG TPA: hypothetical protein VK919_13450 [Solirubrobacterales bacterium]|nr:hypothetical protein [Solirubrobacterales bacterium]
MLAAAAGLGLAVNGCGGGNSPASEPRPPVPVDVTVVIKDRAVDVSPSEVGAGIVNFTVSNQSADGARLVISGPTDAASGEIARGMTGNLKADLDPGEYEVTAGEESSARAAVLEVGPERPSSQNDLLLP